MRKSVSKTTRYRFSENDVLQALGFFGAKDVVYVNKVTNPGCVKSVKAFCVANAGLEVTVTVEEVIDECGS